MNRTQMQTYLSAQECYRVLFYAYLDDRGVDSMELDRHDIPMGCVRKSGESPTA